jgi:hypothetical protein
MAPHWLAAGDWMRSALVACLAVTLVAVVYSVDFPNLWYGEHDISDIVIYQGYAQQMADRKSVV